MALEYKFENRGTVQVRPVGSDKRSPCWYILIAVSLMTLALLGWMLFNGYFTSANANGGHAMTLRGKMTEQDTLLTQQAEQLTQLETQLAALKREKQVQIAANDELNKKLALAETNLASEHEKMVLYEGILSPEGLEQGLHIQHFSLKQQLVDKEGKKLETTGMYQYHLVLAQIRGAETTAEGSYSITITGKQDDKEVTVTQKDLTPQGENNDNKFAVKHYQSLEGNVLLPKDFSPQSVKLKVSPKEGDIPDRLIRSYDWKSLIKPISNSTASKTDKE